MLNVSQLTLVNLLSLMWHLVAKKRKTLQNSKGFNPIYNSYNREISEYCQPRAPEKKAGNRRARHFWREMYQQKT